MSRILDNDDDFKLREERTKNISNANTNDSSIRTHILSPRSSTTAIDTVYVTPPYSSASPLQPLRAFPLLSRPGLESTSTVTPPPSRHSARTCTRIRWTPAALIANRIKTVKIGLTALD
ncbi:hypothetical protein EVAR_16099_1 [Eumeta japonica]|uniref:Uncharacterized protein n=1 Tax=Eumeta variegata TaxID=151549 RepID=A0A4C1UJV9_EUMVA|nr:hypothetical protein EVAR_16099_1 [Eumeta japonica]